MRTKLMICALQLLVGLTLSSPVASQVIIRHSGATDPQTEGFSLSATGDPQLGPVFDDHGLDSWMIQSRTAIESATYRYVFTADERDAAMTYGWALSANMRFVELSTSTFALIEFHTESRRFRLWIDAIEGELIVKGDGIQPFTFEGDALDYHEYTFVYDSILDQAALWIDGVERLTGITGGNVPSPSTVVIFGAAGESITYSHWNEVTFVIIPEPATMALSLGLGALLLAAGIRFRRRRFSPER